MPKTSVQTRAEAKPKGLNWPTSQDRLSGDYRTRKRDHRTRTGIHAQSSLGHLPVQGAGLDPDVPPLSFFRCPDVQELRPDGIPD